MSEIKDHSATCPTCGRYLTVLGCTAERCARPPEDPPVIDLRPALLDHERQRGRAVADVSSRQLSPEEQAEADALHEKLWGRRPKEANVNDDTQPTKPAPCPLWADGEHLWGRKYRVAMGAYALVTSDRPSPGASAGGVAIVKACGCGAEVRQR